MDKLAPALDACIALVQRVAREEVMPRFLRVHRQTKDDGSLFSEADLAAQHALEHELRAIIHCPVIGEEMPPAAQRAAWDAGNEGLWCIDPIDGTTNFINGLPFFAVSVAYLQGGEPCLGITYNPLTDEMFYARKGGGAYLNGQRLPLREPASEISRGVANIDFKRIPKHLADRIAIAPPFYSQRNFGSSTLEWAYLAAGRIDLYLHGGQMLWDYAAGSLLLAEAGGQMATLNTTWQDSPDIWQRPVVAATHPEVFAAWRNWIAEALAKQ